MSQCKAAASRGQDEGYLYCGLREGHSGKHLDSYGYEHKRWYATETCDKCGHTEIGARLSDYGEADAR